MRRLPEWSAADDTDPPMRVKVRIFWRYNGKCAECRRKCGPGGERFQFDHVIALVNGGQNRESNLRLICTECHQQKTTKDVAEKSMIYRKRARAIGLKKKSRLPGGRDSPYKIKLDRTVVRR